MKEQKFIKPQTLFVATAFLISLANFLFFKSDISIHLYDTYYVFSQKFFAQLLSLICIACFAIYFACARFAWSLQNPLGYVHYVLTVIPLLIFVLKPSEDIQTVTLMAIIAAGLWVFGQIVLVVNIIRTRRAEIQD
ncbi:hypothetical protein [Dyadobacter frigoris]|uniref:Uncharacterized protein n=1 Tax=Dyadobacter frigoris TaxID=2576211 RepID=A0A4U6CRZ9_9BACT|nr:hypothetical protein [Dyadobacter frigoris]TKT86956.1 hypothetical protein FDK13_31415 [Dyadobacter frigoris]GLU56538.1 hypothetical protein Dfri01_59990 [Dyadobacter frigoris]